MKNNDTNKSKGYGFIEFKDYIEFKHALDNTEPLILRKKKLILYLILQEINMIIIIIHFMHII